AVGAAHRKTSLAESAQGGDYGSSLLTTFCQEAGRREREAPRSSSVQRLPGGPVRQRVGPADILAHMVRKFGDCAASPNLATMPAPAGERAVHENEKGGMFGHGRVSSRSETPSLTP